MKNTLTIIAHARARPGLENRMIAEQIKVVASANQQPGCLRYELHVSNTEPGLVTFVEQWASAEQWRSHLASDYIQAFREAAGHCIGEFELHEMHQVA